jgi:hypothetical protein
VTRSAAEPDRGRFDQLCGALDPAWLDAALQATGTATLRRRRLPAAQVIWLVLGMALMRNRPIVEVVDALDLALPDAAGRPVAPSAIPPARARVGEAPLRWLFEHTAATWTAAQADQERWRGLAVYGVDGTTVRVPDSPENRAHFGGQAAGAGRGQSGYPLVRLVTLMLVRSHLLVAARFGPHRLGESALARDLWSQVPDEAVVLVDRNFWNAGVLIPLARDGHHRHWLTRARTPTRGRIVETRGAGDVLVELPVSREARRREPSLPRTWVVRAIQYQRRGFRPQWLLTSLVDPHQYPAAEVIALYHQRWEMELAYDEVKTELLEREETIRSQRPAGVAQEFWGVGLMYNLIRLEMVRVAAAAGVPPTRISFVLALRLIRDEWLWATHTRPGAIPRHLRELTATLARFVLPPRRSHRAYPRAVKIKMSNYPRKRTPATHDALK